MSDTSSGRTTNLLSDAPAEEDAFKGGGHERVASALAGLIRDEEGGKAVALQGPYGSGKSTVIEILEDKIEDDGETQIFTYDAWEHQGDPLRRSFLESLIEFLREPFQDPHTGEEKRWAEEEDWTKLERQLAGRTETTIIDTEPKLTGRGRLTLVLLFLAPLGLVLLNNFLTDFWGTWQTNFPGAFFWGLGFVLVLAPLIIVGTAWWNAEEDDEDLFYLLVQETWEDEETKTIKTPDPTTIEFRDFFETILSEVLEKEDRQLIFVVDNLDRLQPEQALATWATMRTFFDKNRGATQDWTDRFWLIVPFNFQGLLSAFEGAKNGEEKILAPREGDEGGESGEDENQDNSTGDTNDENRGNDGSLQPRGTDEEAAEDLQAFIDKTFATTFRVAPPVLSDWEQYMKAQLSSAFPNHESKPRGRDDFHAIYRLYKVAGVEEGTIPTPRDIKLFINHLSSLYRQWKAEIHDPESQLRLPVLAAFELKSDEISQDGHELSNSSFLDWRIKSEIEGGEWQRLFSALHFNVLPGDSIEVLIGERVQTALENGDRESLKSLSDVSGFDSVLDEVVPDIVGEEEPTSITLSAVALQEVEVENDLIEDRAWRRLRTAATGLEEWNPSSEEEGIGCIAILRHTPDPRYDHTAEHLLRSFSNVDLSGDFIELPNAATEWTDGVVPVVRELLANGREGLVDENFHTPYSWPAFISTLEGLVDKEDAAALAPFFKPAKEMEPGGVADSVRKVVSSDAFRPAQAEAIYLISHVEQVAENTDWTEPARAVTNGLQWNNDLTPTQHVALLRAALIIGTVHDENTVHSQLSGSDGRADVLHHLQTNKGDEEIAPLSVLISILHNPAATRGTNRGQAEQGANLFQDILDEPHTDQYRWLVNSVTELVRKYGITQSLVAAASDHQNVRDFVYLVVTKIAETDDSLEHLDSSIIYDFPGVLTEALDENLLIDLLERTASKGALVDRLREMDETDWGVEMEGESNLLDIVCTLDNADVDTKLGSAYRDALVQHTESVLDETITPTRLKSRWPELLGSLSGSGKESLLQSIQRRLIERCNQSVKPLLNLYWEPLKGSGAIQKVEIDSPTETVRERFSEVLKRLDPVELEWLCITLNGHPELSEKTDHDVWTTFKQRIREKYVDAQGAARSHLEEVAHSIGVDLPEDDDNSDSEE